MPALRMDLLGGLVLAAVDLGLGLLGSELLLTRVLARGVLLAWASLRTARRLFPEDPIEGTVVTALLGAYALTGLLLRLLDVAGVLGDLPVAATVAGLCLALLRRPAPPGPPRPAVAPLGTAARVAYLAALGVALAAQLAAWGQAVDDFDCLHYHLEWPAQFRAEGSLDVAVNPAMTLLIPFFTKGSSLWGLFFLLPGGSLDPLYRHLEFPFLVGLVAAAVLLAREMEVSLPVARVLGAALVLSPQLSAMTPKGGNDLTMAFCLLAAAWAARRWRAQPGPAEAARCGLAVGMAIATKYLALVLVPPLLLPLLVPPRRLPHLAAALLALAAVTGPDLGRNLIATGNPLFPYRVALGGVVLLPGSPEVPPLLDSEDFSWSPEVGERLAGPLWPLLLLGALLGPFLPGTAPARSLRLLPLLLMVAFCAGCPFHYVRWLAAPLALAVAAAGVLVGRADEPEAAPPPGGPGSLGPFYVAAAVAAALFSLPLGETLRAAQRGRLRTWWDRPNLNFWAATWREVEAQVGPRDTLLVVGDWLTYPYRGEDGLRPVWRVSATPGSSFHVRSLEPPGLAERLAFALPDPVNRFAGFRRALLDSGADWVVVQYNQGLRADHMWWHTRELPGYTLRSKGPGFRLFRRDPADRRYRPSEETSSAPR